MWYYVENGERRGPFDSENFRQMIITGAVSPNSNVWKEGYPNWVPAGQVPELVRFFPRSAAASDPPSQNFQNPGQPAFGQSGQQPGFSQPGQQPIPARPAAGSRNRSGSGSGGDIPDYTIWAILEIVLCCMPMGIIGLIFASQANTAKNNGDYTSARTHLKKAKILLLIGLIGNIVLSVGFILMAVMLPAIVAARNAAKTADCSNHLKQIGLAIQRYADVNDGALPPAWTEDAEGNRLHSWRVLLLPYLDESALYDQIKLDEPWDSSANSAFQSKMPEVYRCPGLMLGEDNDRLSNYSVVVGEKTAFPGGNKSVKLAEVTDGVSNTLAVLEQASWVNWMDPNNEVTYETAYEHLMVGSPHFSIICNYLLLDGNVKGFSFSEDDTKWVQLLSIAGGSDEKFDQKLAEKFSQDYFGMEEEDTAESDEAGLDTEPSGEESEDAKPTAPDAEEPAASATSEAPVPIDEENKEAKPVESGGGAKTPAEPKPVVWPEGKSEFTVVIESAGEDKMEVVKVVRSATKMGIRDAKDLVDAPPATVKEKLSREDAIDLVNELQTAGATVSVK